MPGSSASHTPVRVIDCDTHFWQPVDLWERFIDTRYREQVVEFVSNRTGRRKPGYQMKGLNEDASGKRYADIGDDVSERLQHMDDQGIDTQIIFPGASRATRIPDPDGAAAACRAVNQWNAEFASASPSRLMPAMVLPLRFPGHALTEHEYATDILGLKSAFVAPTPSPERRWSHPELDAVWKAMQDAGTVVCVHEFTGRDEGYPTVARESYSDSYPMNYLCGHIVECQLALMDLILGGVMERFPRIKFGFIEAHVAWLPGWLAQMDSLGSWLDSAKRGTKGERSQGLLPTEYFRRQCFIAAFPDDAWIPEVVHYVGENNVVLCSDYPHPGTCTEIVETFAETYPNIAGNTYNKIVGENAARIFNLS